MKFTSQVIAGASGSIGGQTFSRNKFGQYIRLRAVPTNPNTPAQNQVRSWLAQLSSLWGTTLTAAQRAAWATYAENVQLLDALGQPINLTGFNHYIRSNLPRLQATLPRVDDGPVVYDLGDYTQPTVSNALATGDTFDVSFSDADAWANEDDAAMLAFGSRQQAPSINYYTGPYLFAIGIEGDSTTPPTSPATVGNPFALDAGNVVHVRFRVSRADGRLTGSFRTSATIT